MPDILLLFKKKLETAATKIRGNIVSVKFFAFIFHFKRRQKPIHAQIWEKAKKEEKENMPANWIENLEWKNMRYWNKMEEKRRIWDHDMKKANIQINFTI